MRNDRAFWMRVSEPDLGNNRFSSLTRLGAGYGNEMERGCSCNIEGSKRSLRNVGFFHFFFMLFRFQRFIVGPLQMMSARSS